jgi:hypothetical protein
MRNEACVGGLKMNYRVRWFRLRVALATLTVAGYAQTADVEKAAPRSSDGHPDFTGIWLDGPSLRNAPKEDGSFQFILQIPADPDSPTLFKSLDEFSTASRAAWPNKPPYKPELLAKVKELSDLQSKLDPVHYCKPPGIPRIGPHAQIVQMPGYVVFLYGEQNAFRVIPTDGRPHRTDVDPSSLGDSVAHWEGDTLVIDVTQISDDTWLGYDGYFHSAAMHVVERLDKANGILRYVFTVEDPNVFARPWVNPWFLKLSNDPKDALVETPPCVERDAPHMTSTEHH